VLLFPLLCPAFSLPFKPSDDDLAKPYSPPPTPSLGVIAASSPFYQAQIAVSHTFYHFLYTLTIFCLAFVCIRMVAQRPSLQVPLLSQVLMRIPRTTIMSPRCNTLLESRVSQQKLCLAASLGLAPLVSFPHERSLL